MEVLGAFSGLAIIFLVLVAILWFILPFAVFGIKGRLDGMAKQQKDMNELLEKICILLDPDGSKVQAHEKHCRKEVALEAAQKESCRHAAEVMKEMKAKQKRIEKEDRRLSRETASVDCPQCGKQFTFRDMRHGSTHACPHCKAVLTVP